MQQINLYQAQFRGRRDFTDSRHLGLGFVLVVVVLALVSAAQVWRADRGQERAAALASERDELQAELGSLQARLQQRASADEGDDPALAALRRELAAKRRLVEHLDARAAASATAFSAYLEGLARNTAESLWLERLELRASGRRMRLAGHAQAPEQVPALLDRLAGLDAFHGHSFRTLRIDRANGAADRLDFVLASEREGSDE